MKKNIVSLAIQYLFTEIGINGQHNATWKKLIGKNGSRDLKLQAKKSRLQLEIAKLLFGNYAYGVSFKTYEGIFISSFEDVQINGALGNYGAYDEDKLCFISGQLDTDDYVYVIGAHIGTLVVPLSKQVAGIVAIEPNPTSFGYLCNNVFLNRLTNVKAYKCGLYDQDTQLDFIQSRANSGGSKILPKVADFMYSYDTPRVTSIPVRTLDGLSREKGFDKPSLIIIDAEGAEYFILNGGQQALADARLLYIEFVSHHLQKVAGISIPSFLAPILAHFDQMVVIDDYIAGINKCYDPGNIEAKLKELSDQHRHVDLMFSKKN